MYFLPLSLSRTLSPPLHFPTRRPSFALRSRGRPGHCSRPVRFVMTAVASFIWMHVVALLGAVGGINTARTQNWSPHPPKATESGAVTVAQSLGGGGAESGSEDSA